MSLYKDISFGNIGLETSCSGGARQTDSCDILKYSNISFHIKSWLSSQTLKCADSTNMKIRTCKNRGKGWKRAIANPAWDWGWN